MLSDLQRPDLARGLAAQVSGLVDRRVGVATLTIGGNDAGFAEVLTKCFKKNVDCREAHATGGSEDLLDAAIADVASRLPAVYQAIHAAAPQAALVVAGYPRLFPARPDRDIRITPWHVMTKAEQAYLNEKTLKLDAAIEQATRGSAIYVDVADAFTGHEVTTRRHWVNVPDRVADLTTLSSLARNPHGLFHPNTAGYRALADRAEAAIDRARTTAAGGGVRTDVVDALAERFRPTLLLDSNERWRPLDVRALLGEGWHRLCADGKKKGCPQIEDADALSQTTSRLSARLPFLQIDGERGAGRVERFLSHDRRCGRIECAPRRMYVNVSRDADHIYLDYWWYFRFNDADDAVIGLFDHQSDWEGVTVAVDRQDPTTFDWVGFAQHEGVLRYDRATLSCDGQRLPGSCGGIATRHGRHVNVFVAEGTHASYPIGCDRRPHRGYTVLHPRRTCHEQASWLPERDHDGKLEWEGNAEPQVLAPFASWAWWAGIWDPGSHVDSPGLQPRFRAPQAPKTAVCGSDQCPVGASRGFEGACGGWFGQGIVAVACDGDVIDGGAGGVGQMRIERGLAQLSSALPSQTDALRGPGTPGVAQLLGVPLQDGEQLSVVGAGGADAELYVRAGHGASVYDVRFTRLGLDRGGRATVRVTRPAGSETPQLVLTRPDGSPVAPVAVVAVGA